MNEAIARWVLRQRHHGIKCGRCDQQRAELIAAEPLAWRGPQSLGVLTGIECERGFISQINAQKAGAKTPSRNRWCGGLAEQMHERVRRDLWGYAADETLDNAALIREEYRGIRPAPGYPACPDHSLKPILFDLLGATASTGITLTESQAMLPTAAVSGFYFAHPESQYFGVARIGRDQVEDYAARKGMTLAATEKWLSPWLSY